MTCEECKANNKRFSEESALMIADRTIKRIIIALFVVIVLWFSTIGIFVWYLNQYDFVGYDYEQNGEGVNIIGNRNGVEYYGATDESEGEN